MNAKQEKNLSGKRALDSKELAEAVALKNIFKKKKRNTGLTYDALAEIMGITPGAVGHYMNGVNPLNIKIAAAFAQALDVQVADFSKRLAREITDIAKTGIAASPDATQSKRALPLVTLAQAGNWAGTKAPYPADWKPCIPVSMDVSDRAFVIEVTDNQLWSICPAGSQVVIDPAREVKAMDYGAFLDPSTGATAIARYVTGFGQERLAFTDPNNFLPISGQIRCLGRLVAVLPRIL